MQSDLDDHGVGLIALSKDTVEEAATHKTRDSLDMTLLADSKLDVIRQYGVEHHKAPGDSNRDLHSLRDSPCPETFLQNHDDPYLTARR